MTRVYILLIFLVSVMEKGNWSGLDRGFGYLRMYFEDLRCNDLSILLDMSIFFFFFALVLTLELYCCLGKIFGLPIMDLLFWHKSNDAMTLESNVDSGI